MQKKDRRSYSVFSGENAKLLFLRCVTSLMYRAPPFVPISASWKRRVADPNHGGAVLRTRASFEQASDAREIVNLSAKERIGQRAAALVEDGD